MDRYIVRGAPSPDEALKTAVAWLTTQRRSPVAIVVPNRDSARNLSAAVGGELAHGASKGGPIRYLGVEIQILTAKRLPPTFEGPVLVPWANTTMVEEAERMGPSAIC